MCPIHHINNLQLQSHLLLSTTFAVVTNIYRNPLTGCHPQWMKCVRQMYYMNMNIIASGHMHPHGLEQIMQVTNLDAPAWLSVY